MKLLNQDVFNPINEKSKMPVLFCFSHLRWDFVYQRPQHLLSRFAEVYSVYFMEEPVFDNIEQPILLITGKLENLFIIKPCIPYNTSGEAIVQIQKKLFSDFLITNHLTDFIFWYYTPMALSFTEGHKAISTVYDCMDELSNFKFAPPELIVQEEKLFQKADIVFTGGESLYQHKKHRHNYIFSFPSSIDRSHFVKARSIISEPADQANIKGPRLGFYGVIDERFDIALIKDLATLRPDWNIILIGPVVKIDPDTLPKMSNVHLLGSKTYKELPQYLAGWDIALIPFILNDSTRFISPTKTPEYLTAGVPVISTGIHDVVFPYGENDIVKIASTASEFAAAAEEYFESDKIEWLQKADSFLGDQSWDNTFSSMLTKIEYMYNLKITGQHIRTIVSEKKPGFQKHFDYSIPQSGTISLKMSAGN